jgi:hypothetical protein
MRPVDIQPIGDELAIKWEDGNETTSNSKAAACLPVRWL